MRRTRGQKNSRVHPKIQTIADDCNCSYGTVQRSLSKLENDLVISIRRTGRASHYFFVPLKADGTPDENSGEYQTAKALLARKKSHSDLANCELSYNSKEIKNPIGVFLSQPEKQLAARRAALLSMVPKGLRLSLAILKLWINVALKYFADDAELVLKRTFESEKPSAYFWKVYQEKIKNPDIKKPQSPAITPAKPQKNMALEDIQQEYKRLDQEAMQNEKNIDEYIKTLSNQEKIDLLFEMKLKFSNFQLKKSGLKFIREIKNPDPFFENRYVRQFVGYENK